MINISKTDCNYCIKENKDKIYPAYKYINIGIESVGICKKHLIAMSKALNEIVREIEEVQFNENI